MYNKYAKFIVNNASGVREDNDEDSDPCNSNNQNEGSLRMPTGNSHENPDRYQFSGDGSKNNKIPFIESSRKPKNLALRGIRE